MLRHNVLFIFDFFIYFVVITASSSSSPSDYIIPTHWAGNVNVPNQPLVPTNGQSVGRDLDGLIRYEQLEDEPEAFSISCVRDWISNAWDDFLDTWVRPGWTQKAYAKACVEHLTHSVERQRRRVNVRINPCHCGVFLGDKLNGPDIARGAMNHVVNDLDQHGMPNTGYVVGSNTNGPQNERFGIAIHCHKNESWVNDRLSALRANHFETTAATGLFQSTLPRRYMAICPPNASN